MFFALVDVAHDWGMRPSQLGLCKEEDDLSVMTAFTSTVGKMRGYESQVAQAKSKKGAK